MLLEQCAFQIWSWSIFDLENCLRLITLVLPRCGGGYRTLLPPKQIESDLSHQGYLKYILCGYIMTNIGVPLQGGGVR